MSATEPVPTSPVIDEWKGRVGAKWAVWQPELDAMLAEASAVLQAAVGELAGLRVLDLGCGTGATCLHWADAGAAQVTGVDVSAPMLEVARTRCAERVELIEADAASWTAAAPYDLVVSRFGLMFFAEPEAAFAHIAEQLLPGGRLVFVCWRDASENPWATVPLAAVRHLLGELPAPQPGAPGPFGLSDRRRLESLLAAPRWTDVSIEAVDLRVCFSQSGGVPAAVRFALQIGPASAALAAADAAQREAAAACLHAAFAPYLDGAAVVLPGAVWRVSARRGT